MKVELGESGCRILASGIDSLVLAINVEWSDQCCFKRLAGLKEVAKATDDDAADVLRWGEPPQCWHFNVRAHGVGGYEWLLISREMSLKVGNWFGLRLRPCVMVEIRSETLWALGVEGAVNRVQEILKALGARKIVSIQPSRVDLCTDVLLLEESWSLMLLDCFVTRAHMIAPRLLRKQLSGFSLGSEQVMGRIYDKDLEIRTKSRKIWMYDIWGVKPKPPGCRVIRVEFQLRREALKQLKCGSWSECLTALNSVWAYCTKKWLRVVKDSQLHHTQQETLSWWTIVSGSFMGIQTGNPAVRKKAIQQDLRKLSAQSIGTLHSIASVLAKTDLEKDGDISSPAEYLSRALEVAKTSAEIDDTKFYDALMKKQAKYQGPGELVPSQIPGLMVRSSGVQGEP